jgi:hypothetical protein
VSGQLHALCRFTLVTYWIGSWVDRMKKLKSLTLGLELRPLGRPARSQSLYRLRYRGLLLNPLVVTNGKVTGRLHCYVDFPGGEVPHFGAVRMSVSTA